VKGAALTKLPGATLPKQLSERRRLPHDQSQRIGEERRSKGGKNGVGRNEERERRQAKARGRKRKGMERTG
jgi:hypothetical protein